MHNSNTSNGRRLYKLQQLTVYYNFSIGRNNNKIDRTLELVHTGWIPEDQSFAMNV